MRVRAKVVASVLLSVSLLATACGARLTAAQRAAGIGALTKNGGSTTGSATGGTTGATTGSSIGGTTGASGATTGGAAGGTTGGANNLGSGSCSSGGATDTGVTVTELPALVIVMLAVLELAAWLASPA